jgi:hypothetical protein
MKSTIPISILILSFCSFTFAAASSKQHIQAPILFEQNFGQENSSVKYFARGPAYKTLLDSNHVQFQLHNQSNLQIALVGSNSHPVLKNGAGSKAVMNYYIGNNPQNWKTSVRAYKSVIYKEVYAGVDWLFYENHGAVEFDFVIVPGADPSLIRMNLDNGDQIKIDGTGNLVTKDFKMLKPVAYQCITYDSGNCEGKSEVESKYRLANNQVGFELGAIDPNKTLVIDPKMSFGTLLGGNTYDFASDVAVDAKGNFYVVGYTEANTRFPGFGDAYVSKFSGTGALIYTTFLVGESGEDARTIAITPAGIAFVGGATTSRDFPRVGAFQSNYAGDGDGYIVKLAVNGTIMKSSFIGGSGRDAVNGIRLGKGPNMTNGLYIIGITESRNFPKKNALQEQFGGGRQDGFLSIIHSVQFQLLFSTYVGSNGTDDLKSLALNSNGDLYALNVAPDSSIASSIFHFIPQDSGTNAQASTRLITQYGWRNFNLGQPLKFAVLTEYNHQAAITADFTPSSTNDIAAIVLATICITQGGSCSENGSLSFFDRDLNHISSTNFGGTGPGAYFVNDIAIGKDGSIYMVGDTLIKNLPVVNAIQGTNKGSWDGFILSLTPGTFQPKFYSYLGGPGGDFALGVAVDNSGSIVVAGGTESKQFPTTPNAPKKKPTGTGDGYVVKITP